MESGLFTWNIKNNVYFLIITLLFFSGCKHVENNKKTTEIEFNTEKIRTGLLICRLGNGFFSNYFRKYASKEQKYSHIGIISIENDSIYVYHSEASELTGVGHVKREKLSSYLQDIKVFDFFEFNYPDSTKSKILDSIKAYHQKKTPFDLDFNSFNDNALYCTELIATSINKVMDSNEIKPSLLLNKKKLYTLDDIYLNENVKKVMCSDIIRKQE